MAETIEPFYAVDFSSLSPEERCELMTRPQDDMDACFEDEPREVQRLALTLIFTRWWNSYKYMAPNEPTPEIIGTAIELLWDFLEGKCGDREFTRFQKSFDDSAYKVVFRDDRGLKEDPESEAFYQTHCSQWESKSYNDFFIWLASLLGNIAEEDGYLYFLPVEYMLFNDIAEGMIDFFETVYQGDRVDPNDPLSGLIRREREIYNTPPFVGSSLCSSRICVPPCQTRLWPNCGRSIGRSTCSPRRRVQKSAISPDW